MQLIHGLLDDASFLVGSRFIAFIEKILIIKKVLIIKEVFIVKEVFILILNVLILNAAVTVRPRR